MRTVFPLPLLERALRQMDALENTLGPVWLGTEWVEMKRKIKKMATECAQSSMIMGEGEKNILK